jgi:predicted secreted protein
LVTIQFTGNTFLKVPGNFFYKPVIDFKTNRMHHKISADSNTSIAAQKGDIIEVQLEETPTAGYSWEIDKIDSNIVKLQSTDYKLYKEGAIGGSGMRTMVFLVDGQGNGKIRLINAQRWSGDIYRQFEVNVNAQ